MPNVSMGLTSMTNDSGLLPNEGSFSKNTRGILVDVSLSLLFYILMSTMPFSVPLQLLCEGTRRTL
jgi:hypothetical protein